MSPDANTASPRRPRRKNFSSLFSLTIAVALVGGGWSVGGVKALPSRLSTVHGRAAGGQTKLQPVLRARGGGVGAQSNTRRTEQHTLEHERVQVDGILVSFCEPEPVPVRKMKYANKVWSSALCLSLFGVLLLRLFGATSTAWIEEKIAPWLRDEVALDLYLGCGITTLFGVGSLACKHIFADAALQVKKRAWIVSVFAAGFCFVAGVVSLNAPPLNWDIRMRPELLMETNLSRFLVHVFRAQAVLDLVLGFLFYRHELHIITSVVHHTAYAVLCTWMLRVNASLMFSICLLEELPTFIMGCGRLNKDLRSDTFFGVTYFVFRVALHTALALGLLMCSSSDERLVVVKFNVFLTWFLHVHWFSSWMSQQHRLAAAHGMRQANGSADAVTPHITSYGWGNP